MEADIAVDAALVRRLILEQHPDLDGPLSQVAMGWDNAIYRLGADLAVRLPRRRVAAELVYREQHWLPRLAVALPVPVPVPVRVGVPSGGFPFPWSITPWLTGTVVAASPVAPRAAFAAQLAGFLAALHVPAPAAAPANPVRGVPLSTRAEAMAERFATGRVPAGLRGLWDELVAVPFWAGPPLWVHGDPHPGNLLTGPDGRLAAVLDFGDLTSGDPATDLAAAWLVFDAPARAVFRAALGCGPGRDEATWQRARGWALNIGAALAADATGTPEMAAVAEHTLREVRLG
ncbi:aminoglycoside phosphotransferase family protein [Dactylosporangium sp. NPDC051484]|uniref:aminoglycoside phosphotransferase family protein n=1 Tax=Dactylosporangium sp. NPDC051484 TaxID=3154942 RepID=UPI0034508F91